MQRQAVWTEFTLPQSAASVIVRKVTNSTFYPSINYYVQDHLNIKLTVLNSNVNIEYLADLALDVDITSAYRKEDSFQSVEGTYYEQTYVLDCSFTLSDLRNNGQVIKRDWLTSQYTYNTLYSSPTKRESAAAYRNAADNLATAILDRINANF